MDVILHMRVAHLVGDLLASSQNRLHAGKIIVSVQSLLMLVAVLIRLIVLHAATQLQKSAMFLQISGSGSQVRCTVTGITVMATLTSKMPTAMPILKLVKPVGVLSAMCPDHLKLSFSIFFIAKFLTIFQPRKTTKFSQPFNILCLLD